MGLEDIIAGDDPLLVLVAGLFGYVLFNEQIKAFIDSWTTGQRMLALAVVVVFLMSYYNNKKKKKKR